MYPKFYINLVLFMNIIFHLELNSILTWNTKPNIQHISTDTDCLLQIFTILFQMFTLKNKMKWHVLYQGCPWRKILHRPKKRTKKCQICGFHISKFKVDRKQIEQKSLKKQHNPYYESFGNTKWVWVQDDSPWH